MENIDIVLTDLNWIEMSFPLVLQFKNVYWPVWFHFGKHFCTIEYFCLLAPAMPMVMIYTFILYKYYNTCKTKIIIFIVLVSLHDILQFKKNKLYQIIYI